MQAINKLCVVRNAITAQLEDTWIADSARRFDCPRACLNGSLIKYREAIGRQQLLGFGLGKCSRHITIWIGKRVYATAIGSAPRR